MGDISVREAAAVRRAAQAEEVDIGTALTRALDFSAEMNRLATEHGDAYREFLDSLT